MVTLFKQIHTIAVQISGRQDKVQCENYRSISILSNNTTESEIEDMHAQIISANSGQSLFTIKQTDLLQKYSLLLVGQRVAGQSTARTVHLVLPGTVPGYSDK